MRIQPYEDNIDKAPASFTSSTVMHFHLLLVPNVSYVKRPTFTIRQSRYSCQGNLKTLGGVRVDEFARSNNV